MITIIIGILMSLGIIGSNEEYYTLSQQQREAYESRTDWIGQDEEN